MNNKLIISIVIIVILLGIGAFFLFSNNNSNSSNNIGDLTQYQVPNINSTISNSSPLNGLAGLSLVPTSQPTDNIPIQSNDIPSP